MKRYVQGGHKFATKMFAVVLTSLALLSAFSALNAEPGSSRIVGGKDTSIEEYPFMSNMHYLLYGFWWVQACGGSLITPNTILSAAHCYSEKAVSSWRAYLGTSYSRASGWEHQISRFIIHSNFSVASPLDADIAIVKLTRPAIFSDKIGTARIAGYNFNLPDNTEVTAVGYGDLWYKGPGARILQRVNINIINHKLCTNRYAYLKNYPDVTTGMFCAGILDVGGRDACQGDSGGPILYSKDIVYGVSSWGHQCGHPFYPGVNALVSYYSDWIVENA